MIVCPVDVFTLEVSVFSISLNGTKSQMTQMGFQFQTLRSSAKPSTLKAL